MLYHISFKIPIKPAVLEKESVQNYKLLTSAEGIWCDKDKKTFYCHNCKWIKYTNWSMVVDWFDQWNIKKNIF